MPANLTLLRWHLGLGDALICNGLVRTLVNRGHRLILPCKAHNRASVQMMFNDLKESVAVRAVPGDNYPAEPDEIRLGYFGEGFDPARWDESFYRQARVPFIAKWTAFQIGEDVDFYDGRPNPEVFVHDDRTRGFQIPMEGWRPPQAETIFEHYTALMDADEIHCINSCFAILADLIDAPGRKMLHRYARPDGGALPIFGREWRMRDAA